MSRLGRAQLAFWPNLMKFASIDCVTVRLAPQSLRNIEVESYNSSGVSKIGQQPSNRPIAKIFSPDQNECPAWDIMTFRFWDSGQHARILRNRRATTRLIMFRLSAQNFWERPAHRYRPKSTRFLNWTQTLIQNLHEVNQRFGDQKRVLEQSEFLECKK